MNARTLAAAALACGVGFAWIVGARADGDGHGLGPYRLLGTVKVPGDLAGGFDISWVDSDASRYYLADRGTTSIDVVDTKHNTFLDAIPLYAAGNGVVSIRKSEDEDDDPCDRDELWVGDAHSFVEVINLRTKAIVADIATNGTMRADELAFDPRDEILVVANDRDPIPFLTFISTRTRAVLGMLKYPQVVFGTPTPTGHGLEQPVWNGETRRFYISVPATVTHPTGEVDEINPLTRTVTHVIPTTCSPAGLALVPGQRLVTSCGDIISIGTLAVTKTVAGLGGDEIWFNRGDDRVYFGGGLDRISVPVLDTRTDTLKTTLTVGVILPPPPANSHTTHSVAADAEHNRIFVPVTHEGVKVYTDAKLDEGDDQHEQ
jgi:hypothetical protein